MWFIDVGHEAEVQPNPFTAVLTILIGRRSFGVREGVRVNENPLENPLLKIPLVV